MNWLIKFALSISKWFSLLFLVISRSEKSIEDREEMAAAKSAKFSGFLKPHVKVSDIDNVYKKFERMSNEGAQTLQIVSDFDKTLSKPNIEREHIFGTQEIFLEIDEVSEVIRNEMVDMFSRLDSILENRKYSLEKKSVLADQIVEEHGNRLKRIDNENIDELIRRAATKTIHLRDGMDKTFALLKENSVPVTVLSAGIGDVIQAVLQNSQIDVKSVRILANFLKYTNGKLDGFNGTFIGLFDKNTATSRDSSFTKDLIERQNIIVIGDLLSDVNMADSAPSSANKLKIGFLNYNVEEKIDDYLKAFDIVIIEEFSMDVVTNILQEILK